MRLAYLYNLYIGYFNFFPQSGMFPTTDKAAGRSGADDSRKKRAERGDSGLGFFSEHKTLSSAFFQWTQNTVVCLFHWTHNAACCFIHWTQHCHLLLSLNTTMSSASFIEHNNVVYFLHWTHNDAACLFPPLHWTQQCRLLLSLNTSMSSASFIEHTTVVCFSPLKNGLHNNAVYFVRWTLTCVSLSVWLALS